MPKQVELSPGEGPIRCPAVRSLVKEGKLQHMDLQAAVQEMVHVFSGQPGSLTPNDPGSLANVTGYFAIFNHTSRHRDAPKGVLNHIRAWRRKRTQTTEAAAVAAGAETDRTFDLHLLGSPGEHPGTVNFFHKDTGEFLPAQFNTVMSQVSDGTNLTIDGIARMIIRANKGEWDKPGDDLDLAKSAGEWALAVCALRKDSTSNSIPIADLERLYTTADSTQLLMGSHSATAMDWVEATAQITAAIARLKESPAALLATHLHKAFKYINSWRAHKLCPCRRCNRAIWKKVEGRA